MCSRGGPLGVSKAPTGPVLLITPTAWDAFQSGLRRA
ncbi:DUF397 domain-containing protein [Streptomyces sp. NPDC005780]